MFGKAAVHNNPELHVFAPEFPFHFLCLAVELDSHPLQFFCLPNQDMQGFSTFHYEIDVLYHDIFGFLKFLLD